MDRRAVTDPKRDAPAPGARDEMHVRDEAQRRDAIVLRALPILLIPVILPLVVGGVSLLLLRLGSGEAGIRSLPQRGLLHPFISILVLVVFVSALIVLVRLGRPRVSALALVGVWTLITTVVMLRAGPYGFAPALFVIPICAAGLLIDGSASVSLAALGTVLVVSLNVLEMQGLAPIEVIAPPAAEAARIAGAPALRYFAIGTWVVVFWTVAGLTSLLAGGLQRALEQRRIQARELSELSDRLKQRVAVSDAQLLQQEREAATLEERTRLAREIHDTLAQGLAGVVVQVGAAQQAMRAALAEDQPAGERQRAYAELSTSLGLAQQMAREVLAEARRSVWNLRSPALERADLGDALRGLVSRPLPSGIEAGFKQRGDPWPLPAAVESSLLRVCQEALINVAKHSDATEVQVLLEYAPEWVRLSVSDNGSGFGRSLLEEATPGPWSGFGLLGMRERVSALGGRLELRSEGGAQVVATVPRPGALVTASAPVTEDAGLALEGASPKEQAAGAPVVRKEP